MQKKVAVLKAGHRWQKRMSPLGAAPCYVPPSLFVFSNYINSVTFLTMLCVRVIPCSYFWGPMSPRVQNDKSTKRRVMGCKLQLIYGGVIKLKDAEERKSR